MTAIVYLLLGAVVYATYYKWYQWHKHQPVFLAAQDRSWDYRHPTVIRGLAVCFVSMLPISLLMGRYVHGHERIDVAYVIINSLIATVVAYFALTSDKDKVDPNMMPPS